MIALPPATITAWRFHMQVERVGMEAMITVLTCKRIRVIPRFQRIEHALLAANAHAYNFFPSTNDVPPNREPETIR